MVKPDEFVSRIREKQNEFSLGRNDGPRTLPDKARGRAFRHGLDMDRDGVLRLTESAVSCRAGFQQKGFTPEFGANGGFGEVDESERSEREVLVRSGKYPIGLVV